MEALAHTIDSVREDLREVTFTVADETGINPDDLTYNALLRHHGFEPEKRSSGEPVCRYVSADGERPLCLIGQWLHRKLGVPLALLATVEKCSVHGATRGVKVEHLISSAALDFLTSVQISQDHGLPWVEAIDDAFDRLPCRRKVGFVTEEVYCGKHGRHAGWPCTAA